MEKSKDMENFQTAIHHIYGEMKKVADKNDTFVHLNARLPDGTNMPVTNFNWVGDCMIILNEEDHTAAIVTNGHQVFLTYSLKEDRHMGFRGKGA